VFTKLGLEYGALAFTAIVGVLQAVAAYNNLWGILFFRYHLTAYIFAGIAIVAPLALFFTWDYHFPIGEIQGSEQTGLFFFATVAAIIFTWLVSSLINIKYFTRQATQVNGLEALRAGSFFRAFWERIFHKH
jgi:uncharacterized membrane protein